jgi:di/tricarboxylate transporter/CRP-like cAMP-binding protein
MLNPSSSEASDYPAAAAQALAAVPLFAALTPVDLAKLAGMLEDRWLDAGTVVFEAGGAGDALYILHEGTAERRIAGTAIGLIHPYAVFGELALLTDEPRSASVVAVTPIRVWVLPRQRFDPLLRGEPELMLHLSSAIGHELARTRRTLAELQGELDDWVADRLATLGPAEQALIEAAGLFTDPPSNVLAQLAGDEAAVPDEWLRALARATPLIHEVDGRFAVPRAIRHALVRRMEAEHRKGAVAARLCEIAKDLEREGAYADAIATYLAAGAASDAERVRALTPPEARGALERASDREAISTAAAREQQPLPKPARKLDPVRLAGFALAVLPLLFWNANPPEGLSPAAWQALLTIVSAAVLFATEALPEAVVALALLAAWVVTGLMPPAVALSGFATQPWVLVLAVLAVGVAVGNTGLLYRVALAALGTRPAGFARRCLTLALVGTAVTPTLPNATSRTALAAPMVREIAEALGHPAGSRAASGIGLAALIGFGQMSALFLTGSSVGLLVHGLLAPEVRAEIDFVRWVLAAAPLHLVLFAASLAIVIALYRPPTGFAEAGDRLALQRAVLGPMRRDERLCLIVLIGLIAGFLTEPLHGVNAAWIGVGALIALAAGGALDTAMMRSGVNWPFLVFFGAITSVAAVFETLAIDAWFAASLTGPVARVAASPLVFCLALAVTGFALAFVVRWQAAAPLLTLVALPSAEAAQVHPFVIALIALVSTNVWFFPYQSTVYLALYHGSGELFAHRDARAIAWLWGALVLVSIAATVPVWRAMGLVV